MSPFSPFFLQRVGIVQCLCRKSERLRRQSRSDVPRYVYSLSIRTWPQSRHRRRMIAV